MSGLTTNGVSDEMLMAFVDGELDEQSAEAVSRAIEQDADVARRAAVFETSRASVMSAFAGVLSAPAPRHLVDLIEKHGSAEESGPAPEARVTTATVVPFARPKAEAVERSFASAPSYALPLAACLALAVGLGSGIWIGQQGDRGGAGGLFGDSSALTAALANQPSGLSSAVDIDGRASTLSVLGSYVVEGGLCRTFRLKSEAEAVRGVACDRGEGFAVDVAIAAGSASGDNGFSPASDSAAESLDAYLDTLEAEGPLSEAEEAERLKGQAPR